MRDERRGETMKLGAFFHPTGNHVAAWRHPEAQIDAGTNFRHYAQITQTAERGKFDLMFVVDAVAVRDGNLSALSRWPKYMAYFDPLTLLPTLAAVTQHIGRGDRDDQLQRALPHSPESCASATPILVRHWRPRSCLSFTAWISASRRCGNG